VKTLVVKRLQLQQTHDQFMFLLSTWAMDAYVDRGRAAELLHQAKVKDNV